MKNNFDPMSLRGLVLLEGVQVTDVPGDHGGLTGYSGITNYEYQAYLLRHGMPSKGIGDMTPAEAADLLLENYWIPGHCDDLPDGVDFVHFAWVVNHGLGANKHLQCAVEAWGWNGREDGIIGPATLQAVKNWSDIGDDDGDFNLIIERYLAIQASWYDHFEQGDHSQLKFLKGWKNRIIRTRDIVHGRPLSV